MAKTKSGGGKNAPGERDAAPRADERSDRPGARSGGPLSPAEAAADEDMRDLFLSEENLIRLAIGHLGGRLPPKKMRPRSNRGSLSQPAAGLAQPARLRRFLAAKLQRELKSRSWTPSELSAACGLSIADCRALLTGQAPFSQDAAQELARAFATSVGYWLSDRED